MRNSTNRTGIKPISALYADTVAKAIHIPMHGGGSATAINLAASLAITRGTITKITLGSTPSPLPMAGTQIKLASVVPADYNGYHTVVAASGADVWIDLDSSALADWTSGGAMSFGVLYDRFGNLASKDIQGTQTGIWANQADGLTAHSAGSYSPRIVAADAAPFDLTGYRGILMVGAKLRVTGTPTVDEFVFSVGRSSKQATYSASGHIGVRLGGGGNQAALSFRPAGADNDDVDTNTFAYTGNLGTSAQRRVAWLLDLRDTSTAYIYAYLDGVLKSGGTITLTGMTDWPSVANGAIIGADLNGSLAAANLLGASASGARVSDLVWLPLNKSMSSMQRLVERWSRIGELHPLDVL